MPCYFIGLLLLTLSICLLIARTVVKAPQSCHVTQSCVHWLKITQAPVTHIHSSYSQCQPLNIHTCLLTVTVIQSPKQEKVLIAARKQMMQFVVA